MNCENDASLHSGNIHILFETNKNSSKAFQKKRVQLNLQSLAGHIRFIYILNFFSFTVAMLVNFSASYLRLSYIRQS